MSQHPHQAPSGLLMAKLDLEVWLLVCGSGEAGQTRLLLLLSSLQGSTEQRPDEWRHKTSSIFQMQLLNLGGWGGGTKV